MVFAERASDFYQVSVLKGAKWEAVAELVFSDELDGLRLVETEGDEALFEVEEAVVVAVDLAFVNCGAAGTRGDIFESMGTGDFFDEVGRALEVGAPAGDGPSFVVRRAEAESGEDDAGVFERNTVIHELEHAVDVEFDIRKGGGKLSDGDGFRGGFATCDFEDKSGGESGGWKNLIWVNSAFEAVRGIRSEEESARSTANLRGGEVG